jgi:hypothetical protein
MKHIYLFNAAVAEKWGYNILNNGSKYTNYISDGVLSDYLVGSTIVAISDVELSFTRGERFHNDYNYQMAA